MENTNGGVVLTIKDVHKSFPGVKALNGVSIEIKKGVVHGIVGENGAGKSTLMKILSGVYQKDSGTIVFDGTVVEHTTPLEALSRGLSIIYQEFNLINKMSVGENIYLGRFREMKGMKGTHAAARKLLDSIGCKLNTYAFIEDLSVSERQMVEIARALSYDSKLIIMDEPSSSLTADELKDLFKIIQQLKEKGVSVIYISHKLDEIFELCDITTVMCDGKVIDTKATREYTRSEMIAKMIGRTIENEYPERSNCVGDVLLEVKNLNTRKLKNISFKLHAGEILGLVGLVGSGRTEIIRALYGLDKTLSHQVFIDGKEVKIRNPIEAKKNGLGLLPEDRRNQGLILPFSVQQNITMATLETLTKGGFIDQKAEDDIAERQIDSLLIKTPSRKAMVQNLSGGNQQKCIVGRWIEVNPRVFILDEPTRGIDVGTKYEIYLLMKRLVESGGSVILISSELPEVLNMSNRVLTIADGRITGEFDPAEVKAEVIMQSALDSEVKGA